MAPMLLATSFRLRVIDSDTEGRAQVENPCQPSAPCSGRAGPRPSAQGGCSRQAITNLILVVTAVENKALLRNTDFPGAIAERHRGRDKGNYF